MEYAPSTQTTIQIAKGGSSFWRVYKKNVQQECKRAIQQLYFLCKILAVSLVGFFIFLLKFPLIAKVLRISIALLCLYGIVKYATILPVESFFLFLILPPKWTGAILSIAVVYSFFEVILI
jgi:hypothetical protein